MSSPWADQQRAKTVDRIAEALERIAEAVETYAAADPLTVLHEALQGTGDATIAALERDYDAAHPLRPDMEPAGPFASNGTMHVYRHPTDERYHVVLRPDPIEPGGFVASVEEA